MTHGDPTPAFEGIDNFRDFGGYPVSGGGRLKRGRLFRSAHHSRATDEDLAALAALQVAVIVDLRRPDERLREPSRRAEPFVAKVVDNDLGHEVGDGYHAFLKTSDLSVDSMRRYLVAYYREAPYVPRHIDLYTRYFKSVAEADGPVLIHCAAGKDRTGILAALTHHAVGVHPDDAMADYLLTNDPVRIQRRIGVLGDYVEALTGRKASEEALKTTMGVEAAYLETAFQAIVARSGSIDAYLETALGVTPDMRAQITRKLVDLG